jgi:MobA/MobL family
MRGIGNRPRTVFRPSVAHREIRPNRTHDCFDHAAINPDKPLAKNPLGALLCRKRHVRPRHPAGQGRRAIRREINSPSCVLPSGKPAAARRRCVASYHLSVHPNVSRGKGQSLVRTAAYNGRCRLEDERTGEVWDYRHLGAPLASGMYAPKDAPDWARDLGQLVNAVEQFERRSDAQLAMNLDIALPHEQTVEQNRRLMQDFVREQFQRKGYAAHFAIHPPDPDGDRRNIHAHVLVTLRKIDEHGFARTKTEQQERYRNRGEFVEGLRESWEHLANRHLERNGYDARIDRRSLQEQGIEREPQQHRGPSVTAMEREGNVTRIGGEIQRRQHHYAELNALKAEERQIDAEIIDLEARRAQRQAQQAARGQVDDIRPLDADRARDAAAEEARHELYRQHIPGYDAPPQTAPEAAQTREAATAPTAPEPELTPSTAHETPAELRSGGDVAGGLADGAVQLLGKALDFAAGLFEGLLGGPSTPSKEPPQPKPEQERAAQPDPDAEFREWVRQRQQHEAQQAAEQRAAQEREAAARQRAEEDARFQKLLEQIRRDNQRREERERDDDYDRGRERDRGYER